MKKISTVIKLIKEKNIGIYVINYEPLKERRNYLKNKLKELGIEKKVKWIIQKPNEYGDIINKNYLCSRDVWNNMLKFVEGPKFKEISKSEINLVLNHLRVFKEIVKNDKRMGLILEDDVILEDDFLERLEKSIQLLPEDLDIAYTDAGMHIRMNKSIKKMKYYLYNSRETRTTASYFISNSGAKKFIEWLRLDLPSDLGMAYIERIKNMKVYWLKGYLTYQGSVYGGYYKTVLQDERKSPSIIKKIIFSIESKRYDKSLLSELDILLLDYLFLIPFKKLKYYLKKCVE